MVSSEDLRPARGNETRRAILEAAMALYARRGVKGTGLAAIGQAAGVTHAGVLYHFGSSRKLLLAVIDERDRRFWRENAAHWEGRSGLAALRQLPRLAEWNRENFELAKLYTILEAENLDEEDEAHAYFLERRRRVRRRVQRAIEDGQRSGEIRSDIDAGVKADEAVSFMDGAQLNAMLDHTVDIVAIFESYTDALVKQLAVRRPSPARRRVPAARASARTRREKR